jgi:hypothetical protein
MRCGKREDFDSFSVGFARATSHAGREIWGVGPWLFGSGLVSREENEVREREEQKKGNVKEMVVWATILQT